MNISTNIECIEYVCGQQTVKKLLPIIATNTNNCDKCGARYKYNIPITGCIVCNSIQHTKMALRLIIVGARFMFKCKNRHCTVIHTGENKWSKCWICGLRFPLSVQKKGEIVHAMHENVFLKFKCKKCNNSILYHNQFMNDYVDDCSQNHISATLYDSLKALVVMQTIFGCSFTDDIPYCGYSMYDTGSLELVGKFEYSVMMFSGYAWCSNKYRIIAYEAGKVNRKIVGKYCREFGYNKFEIKGKQKLCEMIFKIKRFLDKNKIHDEISQTLSTSADRWNIQCAITNKIYGSRMFD